VWSFFVALAQPLVVRGSGDAAAVSFELTRVQTGRAPARSMPMTE
jgi:hypothetical protein